MDPHLVHDCFGQTEPSHNPNGITIGSAVFAHVTTECPNYFTIGAPFPRNCHSGRGSGPPWNTWFFGNSPQPKWHLDRFKNV